MMDSLLWLEKSALAEVIRRSLYAWIQIVHIISFSLMVGAIAIVDLRLLGYFRRLPLLELVKEPLRLAHLSFGFVVLSGVLLFTTHPTVLVINPAFQFKLVLILLAGVNAAVFHQQVLRQGKTWRRSPRIAIVAKVVALLSLILWMAIIACGRLIAYL